MELTGQEVSAARECAAARNQGERIQDRHAAQGKGMEPKGGHSHSSRTAPIPGDGVEEDNEKNRESD